MRERPLRILELRSVRGTGGGPEKTLLLGAARTDPCRYAVTVCYLRDERDQSFRIDQRARALPLDYVELRERHSFDPGLWRQLVELVRARDVDIVHAHDYKTDFLALLLARRTGVIPVATAHGWTGHAARERFLYYPVDRWLLARFPRVIAVSSGVRETLLRSGVAGGGITVALNGIDPEEFRRRRELENLARAHYGLHAEDVVFGAVGRLEPQKNFHDLVRAFAQVAARVPRARLLIAGDGSLRQKLVETVRKFGLSESCRLLGHVDDVTFLHHALNVFVQSSLYEGTPNAVLEAMALETPIVATDAGGTAELARHAIEALIVPPSDSDRLARAMLDTIHIPAAARLRAEAARRRVERELSFEARARTIEDIYEDLADRYPRPGRLRIARQVCATR